MRGWGVYFYQRGEQHCNHNNPSSLKADGCRREGDGENRKGERGPGRKRRIKERCGESAQPSGMPAGPPGKRMKATHTCKMPSPEAVSKGRCQSRLCPGQLPGAVSPGSTCKAPLQQFLLYLFLSFHFVLQSTCGFLGSKLYDDSTDHDSPLFHEAFFISVANIL